MIQWSLSCAWTGRLAWVVQAWLSVEGYCPLDSWSSEHLAAYLCSVDLDAAYRWCFVWAEMASNLNRYIQNTVGIGMAQWVVHLTCYWSVVSSKPHQSLLSFPWARNYPHCLVQVNYRNGFKRNFQKPKLLVSQLN